MRNMGTAASLVSSLIVHGELWGMIVCHHSTPRTADTHMRALMDFVSDLVSLLIAERNYRTAFQKRLAGQEKLGAFTQHLLQSNDLDDTAQAHADILLELLDVHGVAFCLGGNTVRQRGSTPPLAVIQALHAHLQQRSQQAVNDEHRFLTVSNSMSTDFATLAAVRDATGSHKSQGLLYVPLNDTSLPDSTKPDSTKPLDSTKPALPKRFVMWFRDELIETVNWGGNPDKTSGQEPVQRLSPRQSFAAWQETVRGKANPWQELERSIAMELRHTIGAALLKSTEHQLTELRIRTEQVRESNVVKSEFLSRVSHELRTPLNAILGFAQVLSMRKLNDSQTRGVSRILEAGKHLLNLVDEVLDISRVDAGNLSLSLETVSMWEIVSSCIDIIQPLAADKRIELECSVDDNYNPHVSADRQRLKQVVINLLANAVKYNRDDGKVTVHFEVQGTDRLYARVIDTGIGIAEEKMSRLFSPFDRLDIEHESNIQGTGLGLTLTKSLVEAMDGEIGAESVLGQGTTFWFTLPLAQVNQSKKSTLTSTLPSLSSKRKLVVLYIEDNTSDVEFVQYQLADYRDVQLLTSPRADKGKMLALQYQPDVVVVDQFLPDMDSDALISQLREHKTMKQVTIVGLASAGEDASALTNAGSDFVLTKPLELQILLSHLQEATSN
jgi:light-regulated signal transduction histidine kinase (bacteriophytochrome)/CheY-like chemotaxis protein